jgi:cytochrome oxidase Cu insertion factor (SCO1/SenC/PrrC family)
MLKRIRWFLYLVVILVIGYESWNTFQKSSAEDTASILKKFQKDLLLYQETPKQPPNFTLTDQYGKVISLSDFKNKKVVITPIDPECDDVCPLVAQEILEANKQ